MTLSEVASRLGLHLTTVSRLISAGKLVRSGERPVGKKGIPSNEVSEADLEEFLKKYENRNGRIIPRMNLPNGFREVSEPIAKREMPPVTTCLDANEVLTWVVETAPLNTPVGKVLQIRDAILKMFEEL